MVDSQQKDEQASTPQGLSFALQLDSDQAKGKVIDSEHAAPTTTSNLRCLVFKGHGEPDRRGIFFDDSVTVAVAAATSAAATTTTTA